MTDGGYNISDDDSCGFFATGSHNNTDPLLSPDGRRQWRPDRHDRPAACQPGDR